jgi:hypothetical protein
VKGNSIIEKQIKMNKVFNNLTKENYDDDDDDDDDYYYSLNKDNNQDLKNKNQLIELKNQDEISFFDSSIQFARVKVIITKLISIDYFMRNKKLILGKYWVRWSKVLPLKQKCEELGRQLQERLTVGVYLSIYIYIFIYLTINLSIYLSIYL